MEDQLSDIQFIDCNTPDNPTTFSTTAVVHSLPDTYTKLEQSETYQPKNKSPRNSEIMMGFYGVQSTDETKRQSLNLESTTRTKNLSKSYTDMEIGRPKTIATSSQLPLTTPTPQSPNYRQLIESGNTTPGYSPQNETVLPKKSSDTKAKSSNYENVLTTISITYKSPTKTPTSPTNSIGNSIYEDVLVVNPEKAVVPTNSASLPVQEAAVPLGLDPKVRKCEDKTQASLPDLQNSEKLPLPNSEQRPKSLNDLEDFNKSNGCLKDNISTNAVFNSASHVETTLTEKLDSQITICNSDSMIDSSTTQKIGSQNTLSSSRSSELNHKLLPYHGNTYHCMENLESPSDFSLSEVVNSSTENLNTSQSSISLPSPHGASPIVSPTQLIESSDSTSCGSSTPSAHHSIAAKNSSPSRSQLSSGPHQNGGIIRIDSPIQKESAPSTAQDIPTPSVDNPLTFGVSKNRNDSESSLLGDISLSEMQNSVSESQETSNPSENKSDVTFFNISELTSFADDCKSKGNTKEGGVEVANLIEFSPAEAVGESSFFNSVYFSFVIHCYNSQLLFTFFTE